MKIMVALREDDMWELEGNEGFWQVCEEGDNFLVTEKRRGERRRARDGLMVRRSVGSFCGST
jgi:hypothetical protein